MHTITFLFDVGDTVCIRPDASNLARPGLPDLEGIVRSRHYSEGEGEPDSTYYVVEVAELSPTCWEWDEADLYRKELHEPLPCWTDYPLPGDPKPAPIRPVEVISAGPDAKYVTIRLRGAPEKKYYSLKRGYLYKRPERYAGAVSPELACPFGVLVSIPDLDDYYHLVESI